MDKINPILIQKQIRDNAEDYSNSMRDLKNWESEMKRKESELIQREHLTAKTADIPAVRTKSTKTEKKASNNKNDTGSLTNKIAGFDYASWDRFDVDKACADVDVETDESDEGVESEEEVMERSREEAVFEKEKGNRFVQLKNWTEAIRCYSRAIECYPFDAIYYANRALCYLKINNLNEANIDCTSSLQYDGEYVKAYQRRAAARLGLGLFLEAREDLLKVMELEPMNISSKTELIKVEKLINASKPIQRDQPSGSQHSDTHVKESGPPVVKMSWGCDEGDVLVQPIHKPPHLRSKIPTRRIPITEIRGCPPVLNVEHSFTPAAVEVQSEAVEVQSEAVKVQSEAVAKNTKARVEAREEPAPRSEDCDIEEIPAPPTSSVEFFIGWRKVNASPKLAFMYLKQIPGSDLPNIFQESLEPSTLSEILSLLATEFLLQAESVYSYLVGISRVKRVSTLIMFMSASDVTNMNKLLNYCVVSQQCTAEEAASLKEKYELP